MLSDDGIGIRVVERLNSGGLPEHVCCAVAGTAGVGMLDLIAGCARLIIVDAIDVGDDPGTVMKLGLDDLERITPLHAASSHDADLATVLALGVKLGRVMPESVHIVAIQVKDVTTFAERCTPDVEGAVDDACSLCLDLASG